jgi:hypothetical protein
MATANHIIDTLGGTSAVANALGVIPSVVHGWRTYNSIPAWRQPALLELALKKGKPLCGTDFPSPAERIKRKAAA